MTAYARIITTGKNSSMAKLGRISLGVHVDGQPVTAPVYLQPHEEVCRRCAGAGWVTVTPLDPSIRDFDDTCPLCEGEGIVKMEAE